MIERKVKRIGKIGIFAVVHGIYFEQFAGLEKNMTKYHKDLCDKIRKNDIVYYARIMPRLGIFDVYDLKVRTIADTYFVAIDKRDKKSYLFNYNEIGKIVFTNRKEALNKTKEAEKNKPKVSTETYYEEY